jgi:MoaA/NifB/PqqE/SkfB family radical SAM enzyme
MADGYTIEEILRQSPTLLKDCFINYIKQRFQVLPPSAMQLNITMMCNSRCLTCNIWKNKNIKELNTQEWKKILADPFFAGIEYLTISGGEPTLRRDLHEIVKLCLNFMPKLKKIVIPTNGLIKAKVMANIPTIVDECADKEVKITITVSFDGISKTHDTIRGVPGNFQKALKTVRYLQKLRQKKTFNLSIATTISAYNVDELYQISAFCKRENLPVAYYLAWTSENYYNNDQPGKEITIPEQKIPSVVRFFQHQIVENAVFSGRSYYYQKAIRLLKDNKRSFPCLFADQGIVLDSSGNVRYCNNSKQIGNVLHKDCGKIYYDQDNLAYRARLANEVCPTCNSECLTGIAAQKRLFPYIMHLFGCKIPRKIVEYVLKRDKAHYE